MKYPLGFVFEAETKRIEQVIELMNCGKLAWPASTRLLLQPDASRTDLKVARCIKIGSVPAFANVKLYLQLQSEGSVLSEHLL